MTREKKKTWQDYSYCSYQFRTSKSDKETIESLLDQAFIHANKDIKETEKKTSRGDIATRLLKQALEAELRRYVKSRQ